MSDEPFDDEEDFDPEEAERSIAEFIDNADLIEGPSAQELATEVLAAVTDAQAAMGAVFDGLPTNKIIATMLFLSRRHREVMNSDTDLMWRLSAASTLVNGFIRPGEG